MINHTNKLLSSEIVNILYAEEQRIKRENIVSGSLEVDRSMPTKLELIFDGHYNSYIYHPYRLIGHYDLETKTFTWA